VTLRKQESSNPPRPEVRLFRDTALEDTHRLWGDVIVVQPLSAKLLTLALSAAVAAVGCFVSLAEYDRTETVQGYLTADVGVSKVRPPRRGSVKEIFAAVGESVDAGQVLLTVSSADTLASGGTVGDVLRRDLLSQRSQLERKLGAESALFAQERERAEQRAAALESQIEQLAGERDVARERVLMADDKVRTYEPLVAQGMLSRTQFQEERDRALNLRAGLHEIEAKLVERRDAQAQIEQERRAAPLLHDKNEADLRLDLSQLDTRMTELESQSAFAVRAPVAGRVAALQATPGAAVDPEVPIAVILPAGGRFEANVLVPTRAIGFVEPGQPVGIKYAAFPYQQFGIQRARIARVDSAVFGPDELKTPLPVREPVYRMVAELGSQTVLAYGKSHPLQLGMLLEAEIVLERRTILQWLLAPLYSLRGRA
jgi:membrane fusion protein